MISTQSLYSCVIKILINCHVCITIQVTKRVQNINGDRNEVCYHWLSYFRNPNIPKAVTNTLNVEEILFVEMKWHSKVVHSHDSQLVAI